MGTRYLALDDVGSRSVSGHEEVGTDASVRAIRSKRSSGVSGRGCRQLLRAKLFRHRYGHRHPASLEALSRIEGFVLDVKLAQPEGFAERFGMQKRGPAFAEGDDVVLATNGKQLAVAPDVRPAREERLTRHELRDALQVVARLQRLAALRADVVEPPCFVFAMAEGALEILYCHQCRFGTEGVGGPLRALYLYEKLHVRKVTRASNPLPQGCHPDPSLSLRPAPRWGTSHRDFGTAPDRSPRPPLEPH